MKRKVRKLKLSRETLKRLTGASLEEVRGGGNIITSPRLTCTFNTCDTDCASECAFCQTNLYTCPV